MKELNEGWTLTELLVVIAITSILMASSFNLLSDFLALHQMQAVGKEIQHFTYLSKSQSLIDGKTYTICGIDKQDANKCLTKDFTNGMFLMNKKRAKLNIAIDYSSAKNVEWSGFGNIFKVLPSGSTNNNGSFWQCHKGKIAWRMTISKQMLSHFYGNGHPKSREFDYKCVGKE